MHPTCRRLSIWFTLLGKMMGLGYHEEAAADARRRIIAFFDRELR